MPELPEVQTVVDYLNNHIIDKKIISVRSPNGYKGVLFNISISSYKESLYMKEIKHIQRRGKFIIIVLNSGYLVFHLRMTGRLILNADKTEYKYISIQLCFSDNSNLFFHDIRKFGKTYFSSNLKWLENKLGIEPLSKAFTINWLSKQLNNHKRMIKPLLLDQKIIAGLGNIYIDEALWEAKIHPTIISNKINYDKIVDLYQSIRTILNIAIKYNGTTIINYSYGENLNGDFQNILNIFGKTNELCKRCNTKIKKIFVAQRGTHICTKCQK